MAYTISNGFVKIFIAYLNKLGLSGCIGKTHHLASPSCSTCNKLPSKFDPTRLGIHCSTAYQVIYGELDSLLRRNTLNQR